MRELSKDTGLEVLRPEENSTSVVSPVVGDRQGYDSAMVVVRVTGYTDGTHTFKLAESDDGIDFRAPEPALSDEEVVIDSASDTGQYRLDYLGSAPLLGIIKEQVGETAELTFGAYLVKSDKARTG
jgi:hypothetical protein